MNKYYFMKFKMIEESRVISETIEFIFEYEGTKYIGRIFDDGNGNSLWLLDENENEIHSGDVYNAFNKTCFDQWKSLEEDEILDTEEEI